MSDKNQDKVIENLEDMPESAIDFLSNNKGDDCDE